MGNLTDSELHEYFRTGNMGFWKIELDGDSEPALYADSVSDQLFGTSADMEPTERFRFLVGHIHQDERGLFEEYFRGLKSGEAEVIYRYIHPISGMMYVRCTGRKIPSSDGVVRIIGYHTRITDVIHLEPDKLLENRLTKINSELIRERVRQDDYFKELLDMASCGVIAYTLPDHKVIHMNAEALRILEIDGDGDVVGQLAGVLRGVRYKSPSAVSKLMKLRCEDGKVDYECIVTGTGGTKFNLFGRTETFYTPDDERMVVTTFIDVSENVALKNEKSILQALCTDYTAVYICDLIADTVSVEKENALLYPEVYPILSDDRMTQYSYRVRRFYDEYVIKESAPDFLEKTDKAFLMDCLSHKKRFLYRFRTKPNSFGFEHFEMQAVRLNTGEGFKAVIGFRYIDDILHEQERQKEQLENALMQARFNNEIIGAISKIYRGIYHLDLENGVYYKISSEYNMHKYSGESGSIGETFLASNKEMISPEFLDRTMEFTDTATLPERLKDCENISMEMRSRNDMWYLLRFIVKNRDENGKVTNVLLVILEKNEEKNRELEYQRKLLVSAEEARKANIAKTDFLRRMSHDIRTPINGIIGMLSIADHYPDDIEKQTDCRRKVRVASGFLLELINNILDMNKLESGSLSLDYKPFDILRLFEDVNNITGMNAHENALTLHVDNSGLKHRYLLGSPLHLRQIIQNVAGNAVKYNRPGGFINVSCTELSCDEKKVLLRFVCEDNGIGMSEEFQKHAFETFTQETSEARNTYTGTGLGLAITKQLVELMSGTIKLESSPGVGTKFTFDIPFDIDTADHAETEEQVQSDDIDISGLRILLAEDNELNMEIARFLLEKKGAAVTSVWNGAEAVDAFVKSEPYSYDVILMDIMMPVMDGLSATRKIRASGRSDSRSVPIFAMTANAFQDDIRQSIEAGMTLHLSKPLQEQELYKALARCVKPREK